MENTVKKVLLSAVGAQAATEKSSEGDLSQLLSKKIVEVIVGQEEPQKLPPTYDKHGRRLFLPPKDAPTYNPTPIAELKKQEQERKSQHSYIPGGLSQLSHLNKPRCSSSSLVRSVSVPKTSFKVEKDESTSQENVLGDIGDLTDSDEDNDEKAKSDSAHLIGDILLEGMRSGVLANVDEFEQEVIKTKMKMKEKSKKKKEDEEKKVKEETDEFSISCDQVSSSSEAPKKGEEQEEEEVVDDIDRDDDIKEEQSEESKEEQELRLAREEAKRVLEEKELALKKLEAKRKVLEEYYSNKKFSTKKVDDVCDVKAKKEAPEVAPAKSPGVEEPIVISSEDDEATDKTSGDSDTSEHRKKHRRSERHHKSRHHRDLKRRRSSGGSSADGKKHARHRHRSRSRSPRRKSKSSSRRRRSRSSSEGRREKKKKQRRHDGGKRGSDEDAKKSTKRERSSGRHDDDGRRPAQEQEVAHTAKVKKEITTDDQKWADANGKSASTCKTEKKDHDVPRDNSTVKKEHPEKNHCQPREAVEDERSGVPDVSDQKRTAKKVHMERRKTDEKSDSTEEDEDLPETVRSFLDVMNELDELNEIGRRKHQKAKRKSKDRTKDETAKRSSSKSSSSTSHSEARRKSSSTSSSTSSSRQQNHKAPKKHSDSSLYKSSSSKKTPGKERSSQRPVEAGQKRKLDHPERPKAKPSEMSPLPDISQELDMLPDDLDEFSVNAVSSADVDSDVDNGDNDNSALHEDDELRRIFDEYEPPPHKKSDPNSITAVEKKNYVAEKTNAFMEPAQTKKRTAHAAAAAGGVDGATRQKMLKKPTPAQMMMARFKQAQTQRRDQDLEAKMAELIEGREQPMQTEEEERRERLRRKLEARRAATESDPTKRTVAHTVKGMPRLAHTPKEEKVLRKPIIENDTRNVKIPVSVRQRYLDTLVDECLKLSGGDEQRAYRRAVDEEKQCCEKSKTRSVYLSVVVNRIKKLRGEAASTTTSASTVSNNHIKKQQPRNMLTTHMQVLAGKSGTIGTWSIEKRPKETNLDGGEIDSEVVYAVLKRYVLTPQQLEENGYPMPDPAEKGKAIVKEDPLRPRKPQPSEPDRRNCDRCLREYRVDDSGRQVDQEECMFHWGRLYKMRGNRGTTLFLHISTLFLS